MSTPRLSHDRVAHARLAHVRLASADPDAQARFMKEHFGLDATIETREQTIIGIGDRVHSLAFVRDEGDAVGLEIIDRSALERRGEALVAAGFPVQTMSAEACAARAVREGLRTQDASGNAIELVVRPAHLGAPPMPARRGGVVGLGPVGLRSTDIEADAAFWTEALGAAVADWAGDITYLRFEHGHHEIALYPSTERGVLYSALRLDTFDRLMQAYYALDGRQVQIVHGPGREPASELYFLRFAAPERRLYALIAGEDRAPAPPRQLRADPASLCSLGSICESTPELSMSNDSGRLRERP